MVLPGPASRTAKHCPTLPDTITPAQLITQMEPGFHIFPVPLHPPMSSCSVCISITWMTMLILGLPSAILGTAILPFQFGYGLKPQVTLNSLSLNGMLVDVKVNLACLLEVMESWEDKYTTITLAADK